MTEELQTLEQRALAAAAPMEALRFLFETYTETDDHELEREENLNSMAVGQKVGVMVLLNFPGLTKNLVMIHNFLLLQRKHVDSETGTNKRKKEVLWRANFEEFVRRLRHKVRLYDNY